LRPSRRFLFGLRAVVLARRGLHPLFAELRKLIWQRKRSQAIIAWL